MREQMTEIQLFLCVFLDHNLSQKPSVVLTNALFCFVLCFRNVAN